MHFINFVNIYNKHHLTKSCTDREEYCGAFRLNCNSNGSQSERLTGRKTKY